MHIIAVTTFFPNSAEPSRAVFLAHLVREMRKHCDVRVISPVPLVPPFGRWRAQAAIGTVEKVDGQPVAHPRFPVVPKMPWLSGFGYFLGVFRALLRVRRELRDCVVHVHCAYPDAVGVALAARLLGLPYVVTAHGSDINVYAQTPMLRPQIRWALESAASVVVVSRDLEQKVFELIGPQSAPVHVIACAAFDPALFFVRPRAELRMSLKVGSQAKLAVFVGRLVEIKGLEFLIEAWLDLAAAGKLLSEDRLVLIGEGPERPGLEARIRRRPPVAQIVFAGTLAQARVAEWIAAANALCLPSRNEGTPNVIVEALASGVPVVASRVGGIPELIEEGVNGLLFPATDVAALAKALDAAMTRSWDSNVVRQSVAHMIWPTLAQKNLQLLHTIAREAYDVSLA